MGYKWGQVLHAISMRSQIIPPTLTFLTAITEDLDLATRNAIIEVCVAAHQEEDFRNLFRYIQSDGRHFLAFHETELVSHAVATTRWLQLEDGPVLRTAYVDAVATAPAYQGQGCGSALMNQLAQGIQDYEIAGLETDKPGFYERLGWQRWLGTLAGRGPDGLIPTTDQDAIMVLALPRTPPLDLHRGLSIERQPGRIW